MKCSIHGMSLVLQLLRIYLPMQGKQVQSLVQEESTCLRATKPMLHNSSEPTCGSYCSSSAPEFLFCNTGSHYNKKVVQGNYRVCRSQRTSICSNKDQVKNKIKQQQQQKYQKTSVTTDLTLKKKKVPSFTNFLKSLKKTGIKSSLAGRNDK